MTFPAPSLDLARRVLARCEVLGLRLATAESCTGGLIIGCLTEIAGSSAVVERGFVTYDNAAKMAALGVPAEVLETVGAVSEAAARAMAEGTLERAPVDLAIAVTGIAGPGGATPDKPVGLVHLALARRGRPCAHRRVVFPGDRHAIRQQTVDAALDLVLESLGPELEQPAGR
jgi:nicotinamide-nucleotide amidase